MLIISQHARLLHIPFPDNAVFRVNVAWIKSKEELFSLLKQIKNDVFLDFPEGRFKPPIPILGLDDLLEAINNFDNIRYFGVTNVTKAQQIAEMKKIIPKRVLLIPKVESREGIDNLEEIISQLDKDERFIMLDKEDLYTDLKDCKELFGQYVQLAKDKSKRSNIGVLELQGVIFAANEDLK
ncbi:MAG: hypothetical protein KJ977_04240 [Candidatus Omnitrophica bacterium]|nr:hypothetical protein [Candidatus Omnitrophota bacterium]MBU2266230.1 hypothetical protein [Candidatus Omnitrophota bacterium]